MNRQFSIKELEHFSGIKAHTIRIWERRYQFLQPLRSEANIRMYSLAELQTLLYVSLLIKHGGKISKLARHSLKEIDDQFQKLNKQDFGLKKAEIYLILYTYTLETSKLEDILDGCVHHYGLERTIESLVLPFIEKMDLLTSHHKNACAQLASIPLRHKLILAFDGEKNSYINAPTALIFLPKGQHGELILLYLAYRLRRKGVKVFYLGPNCPVENLLEIIKTKQPEYVLTYSPDGKVVALRDYLTSVKQAAPSSTFVIALSTLPKQNYSDDGCLFVHYKEISLFDRVPVGLSAT